MGIIVKPAPAILPSSVQSGGTGTGTPTVNISPGAISAGVIVDGVHSVQSGNNGTASVGTTYDALRAGSGAFKWVVSIEGYPWLLTDATPAAAAVAWAGTDWVQALPGLYVDLENEAKADPWDPFQGGGKCTLRVQADANDTFGVDTHAGAAGAECLMTAGANRVGTPVGDPLKPGTTASVQPYIAVDSGSGIVAGEAYVGTECIGVSSGQQTRINTSVRGKYSPFASGGSGGKHFAQHHRVAADAQGVLLNPTVSQRPRAWIGKWVGVWMHKVDGLGNLNSKADAQCVFAGTIVGITDDPNTGYTVVELENVLDTIKTTTIGRDMYSATITNGAYIRAGAVFEFYDAFSAGSGAGALTGSRTANSLTVVASGATGTNQINADYYSLAEICSFLNAWLGAETNAGRLYGSYSWASPVSGNGGLHTKCYWNIPTAGTGSGTWVMTAPIETLAFLGWLQGGDPGAIGGGSGGGTSAASGSGSSNANHIAQSVECPYLTCFFTRPAGSLTFSMQLENDRGTLQDQYALFPSADKPPSSLGLNWGIFLLNEKWLFRASFDTTGPQTVLSNCWGLSYSLPGVQDSFNITGGMKADDPSAAGVNAQATLRQVFILESTFATLVKTLFYSSGTNGYNHPTYDTLGFGLGANLQAEILGASFEKSIDALPNASSPIACIIDQPTTLPDLFSADFVLRRAFPIWRATAGAGRGGIVLSQWLAPVGDLATVALDETNKAEPSGNTANHRTATTLSDILVKNVVKICYNRDITLDKNGTYQNSITFEDHVSVDDSSGKSYTCTINARNTYTQAKNTGASVESLAPGFMATMPYFSRPMRMATRSIDQRYFVGLEPGDVVLVDDKFMRDPVHGTRGVTARPATIIRHKWSPGGPIPGNPTAKPTSSMGEADLMFLDLHRYAQYAPCAQVDDTQTTNFGYSAGYNTGTRSIVCYPHQHSEINEPNDAASFAVGDAVLIIEIDPATTSSPLLWRRIVTAVNAVTNTITLNQDLSGWDATKKYRITYDSFTQVRSGQQSKGFFASYTTGKIAGKGDPYQYTSTQEPYAWTPPAGELAELAPTVSYGDGVAFDIGTERSLARTMNQIIDRKTAHQTSPQGPRLAQQIGATIWSIQGMIPIFLGTEMLGQDGSIYRSLAVTPIIQSINTSLPAGVRISLSDVLPVAQSGVTSGNYVQVSFPSKVSQATWFVSSGALVATTSYLGISKGTNGIAWLVIETYDQGACYGFSQISETARAVVP